MTHSIETVKRWVVSAVESGNYRASIESNREAAPRVSLYLKWYVDGLVLAELIERLEQHQRTFKTRLAR